MKPVLFVTGHAPAYRCGAFARLHEREGIELALFGGRLRHGGAMSELPPELPCRRVRPRELAALAASGRYRAVVCPTGGRLAPAATWTGTRRARVPLILWASLWAHPHSAAHALTYLPLRHLYRSADAVVTYGPHVSAYVRARGAHNVYVAPQAVDNDFWRAPVPPPDGEPSWPHEAQARFLFVGRPAREKGWRLLLRAWSDSALAPPQAALALVGVGSRAARRAEHPDRAHRARHAGRAGRELAGVRCVGGVDPGGLRSLYAAADVLVVPSIATRTFREPWGLVVNEAMNRGLAVIASDAVGAAAAGLVRDGINGLIVPAGDAAALAGALTRLAADPQLRARMGQAGAREVCAFSHEAWAQGFSRAFAACDVSRVPAGAGSVD